MSARSEKKLLPGHPPPEPARRPARPACLVRESGAAGICSFETIEGAVWLLPLGQLSAAQTDADGRSLRLIFIGAEVRLEGSHLEKVGEAIARGQGFRVCAANPAFRSEYEDEVFVSLIRVIEARPPVEEEP